MVKGKSYISLMNRSFADIAFETRQSITTGVKETGQRTKKKMTKGMSLTMP